MAVTTPPEPLIQEALVEWLSCLFPDRCPRGPESDREVWQASGAQKVIDKIRATMNSQREQALGNGSD